MKIPPDCGKCASTPSQFHAFRGPLELYLKLIWLQAESGVSGSDVSGMPKRYVELLGNATKIDPSPANYLADIDSGFYVYSYLRSWALETQLRDNFRERFGTEWFASREAGSLLRELWAEGQKPTADELLKEVSGAQLELAAVDDRIRETLR